MMKSTVFFSFRQDMNDRAGRAPFAPEILGDRAVRSERPFVELGSSYRIELAGQPVGPPVRIAFQRETDRTCGTGPLEAGL
jgi:hypothetical protein